ncbi:GNAT family protein [Arthrobacter sp. zg-Y820]|uniref:GNAT family N-acetyltransferase n=1 Tax=unclassified Arthrobacter TaxID=235627 RepID=UPI001E2ECD2A|nr:MULTISPECIES: GNAT family protein [unclassified Arthrobacter]MCC9195502.1 GNAT family N-acetyltransferase [Arthrobacter sp. zg-Y820]MDK1278361.1 GNAT family protein [Arthrobacter sp. zg.Y820]MDK1360050.1 GNAT family protein [Arthrobacter sp. zg-Y1219]WIB10237.1 GNAT family protein [Arthrobacter sp. zg-Y820]
MDVTFMPLSDRDDEELVKFLTTNSFPYHRITAPSEELVRQLIVDGRFEADGVCTYWVYGDNRRLGLVIVERLESQCPTFDLRLLEEARGHGAGVPVLQALTGLVFADRPAANRFAGRTREDNTAMRKTFLRSGFLKEAHYRDDWLLDDGGRIASVTYAMLRSDWEQGTLTGFDWEDVE